MRDPCEFLKDPQKFSEDFKPQSKAFGYRLLPIFLYRFHIDNQGIHTRKENVSWLEITNVLVRERIASIRLRGVQSEAECRISLIYPNGKIEFNGSIVQREDSWLKGFHNGMNGITPAYLFLRKEIEKNVRVPLEEDPYTLFESIKNYFLATIVTLSAMFVLMGACFIWLDHITHK